MGASTILLNGRFHTVGRMQPLASAVAIADGKFLAVGDAEDVMRHVVGGICVPALLHFSRNVGSPMQGGMGIPMATDIAFALCVLALLGRLPASLNIFLTALAVIDDLGAIIVIALFYTNSMSIGYLAGALVMFGALLCLNRLTPVTALIPPPTPPSNTALKRRVLPVKMEQRQFPHVMY